MIHRKATRAGFLALLLAAGCSSSAGPGPSDNGSGSSGIPASGGPDATAGSGGPSGSSGAAAGSGPSSGGVASSGPPAGSGGSPGASGASGASTSGGSPDDSGAPAEATALVDAGGNPGGSSDAGPPTDPAARMVCTGTDPIACHFGGGPGNYAVTFVLGGAAAGETEVQAETSREMLGYVATAPGETKRYSMMVNSRTPEGQPLHAGSPTGSPGLDMYFFGSAGSAGEEGGVGGNTPPQLQSIGYAPAAVPPIMVYVAGDSTVCDQTDTSYGGWAQFIPQYFDYPVSVANYANSGESSGSFVAKGLWSLITTRWVAGDWVMIQFGHNDGGTSPTAFHDNIAKLVSDAIAKGVKPVLVTPPSRTNVWNGNVVGPQFVDVVAQMNRVSTEQKVPLIDLTALSVKWYDSLGPNGWQKYHAMAAKIDTTHTNRAGGAALAAFVAKAIRDQNLGLAPYLR